MDVDALGSLDPQLEAAGARVIGDGAGTTSGLEYVVANDAALADPDKKAMVLDPIQRLNKAQEWAKTHQDQ